MSKATRRRLLLTRFRDRVIDRERWRAAFTRNLALKGLSLAIAFALWLFVNFGERDTEAAIQAPLELRNIPDGLVITGPRVDSIDLRLMGPRTLLGRVDRTSLTVDLDLQGVRAGPAVFSVGRDRLNLPRGVRVIRINPAQVTLNLERVVTKSVPVQLRMGTPPTADFIITDSSIAPDQVTVTGPSSAVREMDVIETDPINLNGVSAGRVERSLALQPPPEGTVMTANTVMASIRVEDLSVTRKFDAIPIQLRDASGRAVIRPTTLSMTVEGPQRLVRPIGQGSTVAWVDVPQQGPGSFAVEPTIALPNGVRLTSVSPRQIEVILTAVAPTPTIAASSEMETETQ